MREGKSKQVHGNNRKGMLLVAFIACLLLCTFWYQRAELKTQLEVYAAEETSLQQKIEDEEKRTEEIDELKEYMETDEYAEEVAREKLGLVKDNEIVFEEESQ